MKLVGAIAFITGGDGGIGECLAEAFVEQGMNVVLANINTREQTGQGPDTFPQMKE